MSGAQGALAFDSRDAREAGDFHVTGANREAAAWIDRWPDWPSPGLVVYGPSGCGKSHLLAIWAHRSGARSIAARNLRGLPPAATRAAAVDDVDSGIDERALLHLYNVVAAQRGSVLLSAVRAPARWPLALADLRSRVAALPAVAIDEPDDDLLAAVLVKLFADRQTIVEPALIDYLVARIERSFAAARRVVALLDRAAYERRRALTIPFVRKLLLPGDGEGGIRGD